MIKARLWLSKNTVTVLLLIMSLLLNTSLTYSQSEEVIPPFLCEVSITEGAAKACATYAICLADSGRSWECEQQFYADMLSLSQKICTEN